MHKDSNDLNVLFHKWVLGEEVRIWNVVRFSNSWEGIGLAVSIMEEKRWRHFHSTWENKDGKFIYCFGFRKELKLHKHECPNFGLSVIIAALRAFECPEASMGHPPVETTL